MQSPENFDYLISSMGGVGSTMLIRHISKYASTNLASHGVGSNRYKHIFIPPDKPIAGAVFMIGDVASSFYSLWKTKAIYIHMCNKGFFEWSDTIPYKNLGYIDISAYIDHGEDLFRTKEHIENWVTAVTSYPRMIIKYETMWDHLVELYDFLRIDRKSIIDFPPKRIRRTNLEKDIQDVEKREEFKSIFKEAQDLVDSLDDVTIR